MYSKLWHDTLKSWNSQKLLKNINGSGCLFLTRCCGRYSNIRMGTHEYTHTQMGTHLVCMYVVHCRLYAVCCTLQYNTIHMVYVVPICCIKCSTKWFSCYIMRLTSWAISRPSRLKAFFIGKYSRITYNSFKMPETSSVHTSSYCCV